MMHSRCLGPCSVKTEQYVLSFGQKVRAPLKRSSMFCPLDKRSVQLTLFLFALLILSPILPYRVFALPHESVLLSPLLISPIE